MLERSVIRLEEGWKIIEVGIEKLKNMLEGDRKECFEAEQYIRLYTTIYNMCTQKPPNDYSEELYTKYREVFNTYITEMVLPKLVDLRGEYLLHNILLRWKNHEIMVRWLAGFLTTSTDEVYGVIHATAKDALLGLIEADRNGEIVDKTLIKNVLNIFIEIGMGSLDYYKNDFEAHLLKATAAHYQNKVGRWLQEDSCPEYMHKASLCLSAEEARVTDYLHESSKKALLLEVEGELLSRHTEELLNKEDSGCAALLRNGKREDLQCMYKLFGRVPNGLNPIAIIFRSHVESEGLELVLNVSNQMMQRKEKECKTRFEGNLAPEQHYVSAIITLHENYLGFVTGCFEGSPIFYKALKDAFEEFCNKHIIGTAPAELMANFCNYLLKKGPVRMTEEELETQMDKVVRLLMYVSEKDLFGEFYRKKLAKRLLTDTSISDEAETLFLGKLKEQCGTQFTSKMEGMVNDLIIAREKKQVFNDWMQNNNKTLPYEMSVNILTTGFWPTCKTPDTKSVEPADVFVINYEFSDKSRRIKIPLPPVDERRKVVRDIDKDRKHSVDAAIVRIMKAKKQCTHQNLVMEVVKQLQSTFQPDVRLVKKRIEDLISREFLLREPTDHSLYSYIA